jgi:hypothetical protein
MVADSRITGKERGVVRSHAAPLAKLESGGTRRVGYRSASHRMCQLEQANGERHQW